MHKYNHIAWRAIFDEKLSCGKYIFLNCTKIKPAHVNQAAEFRLAIWCIAERLTSRHRIGKLGPTVPLSRERLVDDLGPRQVQLMKNLETNLGRG